MNTSVIDFLLARKSPPISELKEPGPADDQIATMLKVASRVPDHGRLQQILSGTVERAVFLPAD